MKSDFVPIVKHIPGNHPIVIYPLSDMHVGAQEFNERAWREFKSRITKENDSYIIILGDMLNNGLKSSVSNSYADTMRPREQKEWLIQELRDIADKIICIVPGNHCARSEKDADYNPLYDVACKLDLEDIYRENIAFVKLRRGNTKGNGVKNPTYKMACVHGSGGGSLTGSAVNKNERFGYSIEGIDILCTGHTHKPVVSKPAKMVFDPHNNIVTIQPFTVVTATSWLGYSDYAARKQLAPTSHALQEITLYGNRKEIKVTM